MTTCAQPTEVQGALTAAEVERGWARDRVALVRCGDNLTAVVGYYDDLRARLEEAGR